jgi:hypothetical protein
MTGASATRAIDVGLSNRRVLRLRVTNAGDGYGQDHADWADAKFTCN